MEYQELISLYNSKGLDITNLKEKLEIAKPLKGRAKFRALDIIDTRSGLINDINNVLIVSEIPDKDKIENFEKDTDKIIKEYFNILIQSIKSAKAWKFMKLIPSEYTLEKFEKLNKDEQFKLIFELNKRYLNFLEYQNVADIRDCLKNSDELNDDIIRKLEFLNLMFNKLKNKEVKIEFFCFDKNFLMALVEFRKSKSLRLEDFIKTKRKNVQAEYNKFLNFFTNEDFRDISENLAITSKTMRTSINNVIEAFSEMSESESEVYYIKEEYEDFKQLEKKVIRMKLVRVEYEKQKAKQDRIDAAKKLAEERKKIALENLMKKKAEEEKNRLKKEIAEKAKKILKKEAEVQAKIIKNAKEQVNPLIFSWLEKEDLTITRRVGNKTLVEFFDKIKQIQEKTGIRVSLYIVTNVGKEISLKRMQDFKNKATINGLPNLVEGVLGGYSTFRIDSTGKINDIAIMSDINRQKIIKLLDNTKGSALSKDLLDEKEDLYLRYLITEKRDKSITKNYLNLLVSNLLKDEKIRKQPLKFLPFMEGKYAGIDVLLESQLKGISQLPEYYKVKYNIAPAKTMNVRIDNVESFIEE